MNDQDYGTEEHCLNSPTGKHEPATASASIADISGTNTGIIVDFNCLHCGRGGSVAVETTDANW